MRDLKDKIAVVTGGTRGIGKAIVQMLAREGCKVAFSYAKNKDNALALENELKSIGCTCKASQVDIKNFEDVKIWIENIKKEFGTIDILINNAGILADKALMMMSQEDWNSVIDTNLTGTFNATRACMIMLLKQKKGDVINISSVSGLIGLRGQTNYSASKGGIIAFTKALAKEVSPYGVRVNAIAPGFIETDMLAGFSDEQKQEISKNIPLLRLGKPDEVANCVKFLLSKNAQYITGQIICIDGGLTMR